MTNPDTTSYVDFLDFTPRCILEAGVGAVEESRTQRYWASGADCWLFEPHPSYFVALSDAARPYPNVKVLPVALWTEVGVVTFHHFNRSSFVKGAPMRRKESARRLATAANDAFAAPLDMYDAGTFDMALIDVEGAEWAVLQHMRSRPRLIALELWWARHPERTHKHLPEIQGWMQKNGYESVGKRGRDEFFRLRS